MPTSRSLKARSPIQYALSVLFVVSTAVSAHGSPSNNLSQDSDNPLLIHINDITDVTDSFAAVQCLPFSDDDDIGTWGQVVATQISSGAVPNLAAGPVDMLRACPNYNSPNFSETQRENLWILIMTSMSHYESSCKKAIKAQGPDGQLGGLLQLAIGSEQNYSPNCRPGDATNPARALICGMAMLNEQVAKDGFLFSNKSYWAVMRPDNRVRKSARIKAAIASFAGCH